MSPVIDLRDAVVVVTGGASGIGAALARRFHAEGARTVVVVDRDLERAGAVAEEIGGVAEAVDVTDAAAVADLVARTLARAVVPSMLERGSGWLLNTASAAGLLTSPGDAPYAVTKHGAVAFAEWLAVTYGDRGIGVSVLCPMGVSTPLLMDPLAAGDAGAQAVAASGEIISAEQVADVVVAGLAEQRFLLLPHTEVATFWRQKATDPDRWLSGMRRLVAGA